MSRFLDCLLHQHDPRLVALAAIICVLCCFTAVSLMSRAQHAVGRSKRLWTALAAVEFGSGVWSLHFVAMLAFMPALHVAYDIRTTLVSVAIAVGGAGCALSLLANRNPGLVRTAASVLCLAAAVGGMHYVGIVSMRLAGRFVLDAVPVAWSFAFGILFSLPAALAMRDLRERSHRVAAALSLTTAIVLLHFTGMSAMHLRSGAADAGMPGMPASAHDNGVGYWSHLLGSRGLAIVVASSSVTLVLVSLALSFMDRLLVDRAYAERTRLRKLSAVSFEALLIERHGKVADANDRLSVFTGRELEHLVGAPVASVLPSYRAGLAALDARAAPSADGPDHVLLRADGGRMPVELLAEPIEYEGRPATAIAIRDLTSKRDSEAALHRLAHHDPLTGLANRLLLETRMRRALADPSGECGAVLCLDLDRFKSVNDLLGHAAGDKLLVAVARRLSALLRQADTLSRLGGDEFVILVPETDGPGSAEALASRIVARMAEPFDLDEQQVVVGTSIGIALFPRDGDDADQLLRCADIAMYCAKEAGRSTSRVFEPAMDIELQRRHALERDLRAAIEAKSLALHYQPLVSCETGEIEGYEALLRWRHPERGFVPPNDFIPIAEESGLILPLGHWVLRTACAAAAAWERPNRVAVNLSPVQFRQTELVDLITAVLDETGLPAGRLEVEVTEGVLIDDPARAVSTLTRLRALGVKVSLDDFGTGYSSLSYLRQFPLDKIKIDRSFIIDLGSDQRSGPIVRAVVALAHSLGLCVTAEGVETEEQLAALRAQSCNQVQGFLLGRPGPLAEPPEPANSPGSPVEVVAA